MACIASSFTGSVAALKATKIQVCFPSGLPDAPVYGGALPDHQFPHSSRSDAGERATDDDAPLLFPNHQAKSVSKVIKADIYPEFGTYPGGGESPIIPFGSEKNAEREVIHGRWAMLGVTGAWAAENGTGIPWFTAGTLCTPDDCTAVADKFPGAVAPSPPRAPATPPSGPSCILEGRPRGLARLTAPASPTPSSTSSPSVTCPPVAASTPSASPSPVTSRSSRSRSSSTALSMFAWLGCIFQGLATQEGPIANWQAHVADPSTPTCSPTPPPASATY